MTTSPLRSAFRVTLALLGLAAAQSALACSCAPSGGQAQAFADAARVFRATVIQTDTSGEGNALQTNYRMLVNEAWKGDVDPLQTMFSTPDTCGRVLEEGEEYLIYTSNNWSNICARQMRVSAAAADLAALGPGQPPATVSTTTAFRNAQFSGTWYQPTRPGQGLLVQVLPDGRASVAFFGYLNGSGDELQQAWLVGIGEFTGNRLDVPNVVLTRGRGFAAGFNPGPEETIDWGSFTLNFSGSGTSLSFLYETDLPGFFSLLNSPRILDMERLTGIPSSFVLSDGNP